MSKRIRITQVAESEGYKSVEDMLEKIGFESIVPACCDEGCQVEPDGKCEHGNPSILLALGLI